MHKLHSLERQRVASYVVKKQNLSKVNWQLSLSLDILLGLLLTQDMFSQFHFLAQCAK